VSVTYRFTSPDVVLQALERIIDFVITDIQSQQTTVTWTAPSGATSQQPQYKQTSSGTWLDFGSALGGTAGGVTYTGLSNGISYDFRVQATDGNTTTLSNEVTATPGSGDPYQITDLTVIDTTTTTITLRWTEVNDGDGNVANTVTRYATPTLSNWGSAVGETFFRPGVSIGTLRTYQYTGLTPSTTYQFAAKAYSGIENVNANYGLTSNIAQGTTLTPVTLGTIGDLAAPAGQIGNASVGLTWSDVEAETSYIIHRSTSSGFTPAGVVAGQYNCIGTAAQNAQVYTDNATNSSSAPTNDTTYYYVVRATDGTNFTSSNEVSATPTAPAGGTHPNEPTGMSVVGVQPMDSFAPAGWTIDYTWGIAIVSDATAPLSPPNVARATYPAGELAGSGPFRMQCNFPTAYKTVYIHWAYKFGDPYWESGGGGVNKMLYLVDSTISPAGPLYLCASTFSGSGSTSGGLYLEAHSQGGVEGAVSFRTQGATDGSANEVAAAWPSLTRGSFHKLEFKLVMNDPGVANGEVHGWVNGTKVFQFTGRTFGDSGATCKIEEVHWGGVFGGTNYTPTVTQYAFCDHIYISGKN